MKLLKFFTKLSVFSIILGEVFRVSLGNDIFIKPQDALIVICVFLFIIYCIKVRKFPKNFLLKPIAVFTLFALIALLVNSGSLNGNQLLTSFSYLIRWVMYAAMYVIIVNFDDGFKKTLIKVMFVSGLIVVVCGYLQYFLYPNLRNLYYLGWDEHNYRMFSVFLDPNFAGAFFVLFLLFAFEWINIQMRGNSNRNTILLYAVAILTFTATLLTYSRSAILMLVTGLVTYLILIRRKKLIFLFFGISALALVLLSPTFNKENTNLLRVTSGLARLETYDNAIEIIKDRPLFGVGFNAYRYTQQLYGFRDAKTQFENHADSGVDNSFLFVFATTGILGLSAYIYLWFRILNHFFILKPKKVNIHSAVIISSVSGLFINSLFINSLFFAPVMLWMWAIIGVSEKVNSTQP